MTGRMLAAIACVASFSLDCEKADGEEPSESGSADAGTSESSESGGSQWPEVCAEHLTQESCGHTGQYGCVWTEIFDVSLADDACAPNVVRSECVAFENQGNGCAYVEGPESCGEDYPAPWYRDGASGIEYMADLCERLPVGWSRCSAESDAPAGCACACIAGG